MALEIKRFNVGRKDADNCQESRGICVAFAVFESECCARMPRSPRLWRKMTLLTLWSSVMRMDKEEMMLSTAFTGCDSVLVVMQGCKRRLSLSDGRH
jgi:hypothetical protein